MSRARALMTVTTMVAGTVIAAGSIGASAGAAPPAPVAPRGTVAAPSVVLGHRPTVAGADVLARQARAAVPAARPTGVQPGALGLRPASNGAVVVSVTGAPGVVRAAVLAVHGTVLAAASPASTALVPKTQLTPLASRPGVVRIDAPSRPHVATAGSGPSEAVPATGADQWHAAELTGAGQSIAIVDFGFGVSQSEYAAEVAAGHLGPDPQLVNEDCVDNGVPTPTNGSSYGLATAEQASQQAPDAAVIMYCVASPAGVASAEADIESRQITVVSSSLTWYGDARGDGTGPNGSVAATVAKARRAGVLWFNATGDDIPQHWSGSLADVNRDGYVDMGNHDPATYPYESNFFWVRGTRATVGNYAAYELQWDQWPTTSRPLQIDAYGFQCTSPYDSQGNCRGFNINGGFPLTSNPDPGGKPTAELSTADYPITGQYPYDQIWQVLIQVPNGYPAGARYDLTGLGDFHFGASLSCPQADSQGFCIFAAPAIQGSLTSPSNSPDAVGVGAVDVGADGRTQGTLETSSAQGPTIDRRTKPELASWDGVSSYVPEFNQGFYGTSASTPIAAGTALLVKQLNPSWDPAQVLNLLEQRANNGAPNLVPTNQIGYGRNTLGQPSTPTAPPAKYQGITPTRIYDQRTHNPQQLGAGGTLTITVPGLPSDATAVAINLTGAYAKGTTFLSVYPGSTWPGTSNLNLDAINRTAAVFAVVTLGPGHTITVRNNAAAATVIVDELGYFGTNAETGGYAGQTPTRAIDTGTAHLVPSGAGTVVRSGAPAGATAAIVNITADSETAPGYLAASAACSGSSSTLNYLQHRSRANLAIVGLNTDGTFCIYNLGGSLRVIADVVGFISPGASAGYVALPSPTRIVDTRYGNGNLGSSRSPAPITGGSTQAFYASGVGTVPADASALVTGLVEASATSTGYLQVVPGSSPPTAPTSNLNYSVIGSVPNAVITPVSSNRFAIFSATGYTHCVVDLFGYFE